ncbi:MAG: peptide deformylase [Actinomycetes bacterium]|jgi:peptide deformylase|nr:peptide deformylase [Actinomycetes bacterium]
MTLKNRLKKLAPARILDVVRYPDPLLNTRSAEIDLDDERDLDLLARDMLATMRKREGVGLAAIQVGIPKRMLVYDVSENGDDPQVLINPRITATGDEQVSFDEGCLSFPGMFAPVIRPDRVTVTATALDGSPLTVTGTGLTARVLQHEIDHLDGVTFITHVDPDARKAALREYFNLGE